MFDWFRQLFSGQPGPPPEGFVVERDERGRITKATATLSAGPAADPGTAHPALAFTPAQAPMLRAASQWLCERNIAAAQGWAIGLERDYAFDQADGRLLLKFEHGPDLALDAQVLGSFDPAQRSFMWGWHNPSLRPELQQAARRVREAGERDGDAALTTPVLAVSFDPMSLLLARAAQMAGVDGVYRAITESMTSVFLGYRLDGIPARLMPADPAFVAQAVALAQRHDQDQAEQDRRYHEQRDAGDGGLLNRIVDEKMTSWRRDWARDDEYWHPCSTAWPSDHDRSRAYRQFCAPHPRGGVLEVTIRDASGRTVYRIEQIDGAAKITDRLIGWGNSFLWPRVVDG